MINWGISAGYHDAALSVIKDGEIVFASHAERYSGYKNDKYLNDNLLNDALQYGEPDKIYWYENPVLKATRRLYSRQPNPWVNPKSYFDKLKYQPKCKIKWGNHHRSHFAAGYYTRPFDDCATLVIDAIGEWVTTSIWDNDKLVWSRKYPNSLGLFYSAFTDRVGLKANEDEYILMGMSAYGDKYRFSKEISDLLANKTPFHRGVKWWRPELEPEDYFDVAAGVQSVYEKWLGALLHLTAELTRKRDLVFMGGCALNCLANRLLPDFFRKYWIMPNPGDAGSSLGAVLAGTKQRVDFKTAYLGHDIKGEYPVDAVLHELMTSGMVGVASGRAEFGPRALGNRSLLADPRGQDMKDKVNSIKRRQEFRPFAPVIRQCDAQHHFDVDVFFNSPYMQEVVRCKEPEKYPAIVHKDGTSRVQTVSYAHHPELYVLLTKWYEETGCPMLLNTSLNIKGKPIVNNRIDADVFENFYGVKVCTP